MSSDYTHQPARAAHLTLRAWIGPDVPGPGLPASSCPADYELNAVDVLDGAGGDVKAQLCVLRDAAGAAAVDNLTLVSAPGLSAAAAAEAAAAAGGAAWAGAAACRRVNGADPLFLCVHYVAGTAVPAAAAGNGSAAAAASGSVATLDAAGRCAAAAAAATTAAAAAAAAAVAAAAAAAVAAAAAAAAGARLLD
jgi:hypothetical protein